MCVKQVGMWRLELRRCLLPANNHGVGTVAHLEPQSAQFVPNDNIRTTASVMPLQIPDPPPVQNKTFPLKMSSLKTALESTTGKTDGVNAIVVYWSPDEVLLPFIVMLNESLGSRNRGDCGPTLNILCIS